MLYLDNIKNNIEKILEEEKLSIGGLEKKLGVSRGTIHKILIGKSKNPTIITLVALAKTFGSSLDELVFGVENEDQKRIDHEIWNKKLMGAIFKETCYYISDHKVEPNLKMTMIFMIEMYNYFLSENDSIFDKQFFVWCIKKEIK